MNLKTHSTGQVFFPLQQDLDSVVSEWCLMNLIIASNPISTRSQGIYRCLSVPHIPPGIFGGNLFFLAFSSRNFSLLRDGYSLINNDQ